MIQKSEDEQFFEEFSIKDVSEEVLHGDDVDIIENWSIEDRNRMDNILNGMTDWINKYADLFDDPLASEIVQNEVAEVPTERPQLKEASILDEKIFL